MRAIRTVCILSACLLPVSGLAAPPEQTDEKPSTILLGLEVDTRSRYVWRGIPFSEGAVQQTSFWMTASDLTLSIWSNANLDRADGRRLNEVDVALSYARPWRNLSLEPALTVYFYPNQPDSPTTGEASLKIIYPLDRLNAFTSHSFDMMRYAGSYFGDVGLSYARQLRPRLAMESSASLGWASSRFNEVYVGARKSALNVACLEAALTYQTGPATYLRAHLGATWLLDNDLRQQVRDSSLLCIGLALGTEF